MIPPITPVLLPGFEFPPASFYKKGLRLVASSTFLHKAGYSMTVLRSSFENLFRCIAVNLDCHAGIGIIRARVHEASARIKTDQSLVDTTSHAL